MSCLPCVSVECALLNSEIDLRGKYTLPSYKKWANIDFV